MRDKSLSKAIEIIGGNAATGRALGITREAVGQWKKCPAERVRALSEATGGKVSPQQLRPDLFRGMQAAE